MSQLWSVAVITLEQQLRALVAEIVRAEIDKLRPAEPEALTVAEFARRLSVSERTVRDAIREGRLEHMRIGRAVRIPSGARIEPRVEAATARARLVLLGGKR